MPTDLSRGDFGCHDIEYDDTQHNYSRSNNKNETKVNYAQHHSTQSMTIKEIWHSALGIIRLNLIKN